MFSRACFSLLSAPDASTFLCIPPVPHIASLANGLSVCVRVRLLCQPTCSPENILDAFLSSRYSSGFSRFSFKPLNNKQSWCHSTFEYMYSTHREELLWLLQYFCLSRDVSSQEFYKMHSESCINVYYNLIWFNFHDKSEWREWACHWSFLVSCSAFFCGSAAGGVCLVGPGCCLCYLRPCLHGHAETVKCKSFAEFLALVYTVTEFWGMRLQRLENRLQREFFWKCKANPVCECELVE